MKVRDTPQINLSTEVGGPPRSTQETQTYSGYITELKSQMETVHSHVRRHLNVSSRRQKKDHDTRISLHNYKTGDLVYCFDSTKVKGKSPKLKCDMWKGPFIITDKMSDLLFKIWKPKSKVKVIHHDRLKYYTSDVIPEWVKKTKGHVNRRNDNSRSYATSASKNSHNVSSHSTLAAPRRNYRIKQKPHRFR